MTAFSEMKLENQNFQTEFDFSYQIHQIQTRDHFMWVMKIPKPRLGSKLQILTP